MELAVQISGAIVGWTLVDIIVAGIMNKRTPLIYRIGFAFVGTVVATAMYNAA